MPDRIFPGERETRASILVLAGSEQYQPCNLVNEIVKNIICNPGWLQHMAIDGKKHLTGNRDRAQNADKRFQFDFIAKHLKAADIKESLFLFALGVQLAADQCGSDISPECKINDERDASGAYVFYRPADDQLIIRPHLFFNYAGIKHADKASNAAYRTEFLPEKARLAETMITSGMEMYYKVFQSKDSNKWGQLEAELISEYGTDWPQGQEERYNKALEAGNIEEFFENDPITKDATQFMTAHQSQINTAIANYNRQLKRRR